MSRAVHRHGAGNGHTDEVSHGRVAVLVRHIVQLAQLLEVELRWGRVRGGGPAVSALMQVSAVYYAVYNAVCYAVCFAVSAACALSVM